MFPDEMVSLIGKVAFFLFAVCAVCMSRAYSVESLTSDLSPKVVRQQLD